MPCRRSKKRRSRPISRKNRSGRKTEFEVRGALRCCRSPLHVPSLAGLLCVACAPLRHAPLSGRCPPVVRRLPGALMRQRRGNEPCERAAAAVTRPLRLGSGSGVGSFSQKGEFSNIPLFLAKCRPVVDVTATKCTPVVTPGAAGRRWHRESGGRPRVRPPGVCCRRPACCTSSPAKGSWFSSGKSRKSGTSSRWLGLGRRQQMGSCRSTAAN